MAPFRMLCLLFAGARCLGSASASQCAEKECESAQTSSLLQKVSSVDKSMVGGGDEHAAAVAEPSFMRLRRIGVPYDQFADAPGISNYMFGDQYDNECPAHSTEVNTAEECQAAFEVLHVGSSRISWSGVVNRSGSARGCYLFKMTSDLVQYNQHPTGAGTYRQYKICKADFLFGETENTTCPYGSRPIGNETTCRSAGLAVLPKDSWWWAGVKNDADEPHGCHVFWGPLPMLYYNEHPEGKGKRLNSVLCAAETAKE